jgi:hypothetical protein
MSLDIYKTSGIWSVQACQFLYEGMFLRRWLKCDEFQATAEDIRTEPITIKGFPGNF